MHFSAIFGSYNYDPVKQKFEPHQFDVTRSINQTGFTVLGDNVHSMATTTIRTPTDSPQGGLHGNHTDMYPTAFVKLRAEDETDRPTYNSVARSGPVVNSTTTQMNKTRKKKKKKIVKKEKEHRKNAVVT